MIKLVVQASWVLIAAFALSLLYELYRATVKAGVSESDSMRLFVTQAIPVYIIGFIIAVLVRRDSSWATWLALLFSLALIGVSIFYYPVILLTRLPGPIDWFEDRVFTGLLFVAAALLVNRLARTKLE